MYEPGTTRLFHEYLKEGDQVIIAGAHQGYFATLAASLIGPKGTVYAFEPEPKNREILKSVSEPFGNVKIYDCALGERNQKAPFFFNSDNDGGHSLWDPGKLLVNKKSRETPIVFEVEVKRLDEVLEDEDISRLKLILFDVEGAEHSVLKGAINTIVDSQVPYIITEINGFALERCQTSQGNLTSFLSLYGYKPFAVVEQEDPEDIVPIKDGDVAVAYDLDGNKVVFNMLFKHLTAR